MSRCPSGCSTSPVAALNAGHHGRVTTAMSIFRYLSSTSSQSRMIQQTPGRGWLVRGTTSVTTCDLCAPLAVAAEESSYGQPGLAFDASLHRSAQGLVECRQRYD